MEIKILGIGCSKCKVAYKQVKKAVDLSGRLDIDVTKVESLEAISKYNIMATPAILIDESIKISGRIPSVKEILNLIKM